MQLLSGYAASVPFCIRAVNMDSCSAPENGDARVARKSTARALRLNNMTADACRCARMSSDTVYAAIREIFR
jgi:hypothetical protein